MSNINMSDDAPKPQMAPDMAGGYAYASVPSQADVEKNKVMAIIAYLGILFIVPLLAAKDSPFAMYHANQGLVLFLLGIAVGIVGVIPVVGWLVAMVGIVAHLVLLIMGIINAANGLMKPLPLIGGITLLK